MGGAACAAAPLGARRLRAARAASSEKKAVRPGEARSQRPPNMWLVLWLSTFGLCLPSTSGTRALPARIVVAADATEAERWAAANLAGLLMLPAPESSEASGTTAGTGQIAVGHGAATALGVRPATLASLGDDSYLISSTALGVPPGSVAIASSAHSARGTVYGVFAFLRALGFEFFAENATRVPNPWPTKLPAIHSIYTPSMESRNLVMASPGIGSNYDRKITPGNCSAMAKAEHWRGGSCQGRNGSSWWRPGRNLSAALQLNGDFSFGPVGVYLAPSNPPGFVATAYNLLTPTLNSDASDCAGPGTNEPHESNTICPAVFRQHPEWFTCGQPAAPCTNATIGQTFSSQPCWSAPGVEATMTQNILRILRADPSIKIISVSNMDGGVSYSPCPLDMAAATAENATGGANFYVVRNIAAAVQKEFPGTKILALAYNGAQAPPKHLVFAQNVIVQIAGQRYADVSLHHEQNAADLALIQGWLAHSESVYIWNGVNEGSILPHGDYLAQALHIKELAKLGVKGYFAEGSTWPGSDMVDLRVFLAGRMMFDATLDIDTLVAEFLETYYGGGLAAASVGEYIKAISAAFQTGNNSIDFTGRVLSPLAAKHYGFGPNSSFFRNDTLLRGAALLVEARKAATEPKYEARITYDLMHLQYVCLVRWDSLRVNATATKTQWPLHATKAEEFESFATAFNASEIQGGFQQWKKYPPRCHGASPCWTNVKMTLASFHAELFGN
jgi:hypothetical protein